jgi:hypothetical protein
MLFHLVLRHAVIIDEEWATFITTTNDQLNPSDLDCIINTKMPILQPSDLNSVGAHICRLGRTANIGDPVCINPFHLIYTTQQVNIDHNRCAYGSRATCPHGNCVWTWPDTGEPKYCLTFKDYYVPSDCDCARTCGHYPIFQ